ncbi:hypothetical protein HYH02_014782 [Chlamydomonas schloesseri]|uniref:Arp2/3 complex 34 kDa subunit n=1 Tax=Chlamydomonas schloesseri TaxID=2026947 RepID=A0A835SMW0_9CHLO|nr:hypothetical protein HYH02_014782 [Chlamydomonas schloesseri]|eukprot:KAG2426423.1 hypothetical protein HYH02_014782 [Chlamydomonas schloesseri]
MTGAAPPPAAGAASGGTAGGGGGAGGGVTVRLEFSLPRLPAAFQRQVLGPDVRAALAAAFQGVARLLPPSEASSSTASPPPPPPAAAAAAGPEAASSASTSTSASTSASSSVALEVDVGLLARLSAGQRQGWSRSLASVRLLLAGHPIRQVFLALEAGSLRAGPPVVCCNTPGQVYVIKPGDEGVTLVFPLRFSSRQDTAMGVACLQEFVEARRGAALGRAPVVAYSSREPPGEMAGVDLSQFLPPLLSTASSRTSLAAAAAAAAAAATAAASGGGADATPQQPRPHPQHAHNAYPGGYLSFSFSRRHVTGPQMEGVVWSMACLHAFVAYHVKACKAMMHSRMRRRVASMCDLLGGPAAAAAAAAAAGGPGAVVAGGAGGGGGAQSLAAVGPAAAAAAAAAAGSAGP